MSVPTCTDTETPAGRRSHAWMSTGLDLVGTHDELCNTRRCVWCGTQQFKPYGKGGKHAWREVNDAVTRPHQKHEAP